MELQARDIQLHLLVESYAISACSHIGEKRLLPSSCPSGCIPAAPTECIHSKFDIWNFCENLSRNSTGEQMSSNLHEAPSTFCCWRYQIAI